MNPPANPVSVVGARILDVSPFGMRIESPVAISTDTVLAFRIVVEGRATDVGCRVATCRPGAGEDQSRFGVGLEFLDLPDETADRLRKVLQRPTA
jgi:PilZ domain